MNLNREADQAAEADPAVAVLDAADPAADDQEVADTEAVKAAVATAVEAGGREVTISGAGRHAVARMVSRLDSNNVHDLNSAT
ncbi:MAG: hypothetical protein IAG10_26180, partial [Planctomycetaceae bacterium]|nr:hypothetical protein [Planctomycetaceae bacterium]